MQNGSSERISTTGRFLSLNATPFFFKAILFLRKIGVKRERVSFKDKDWLAFAKIHKHNHFRKDCENSKNSIFLKMHAPFVMIRVDSIMFNRGHAECITSLLGCLLKYSHQTHLALKDLTFHLLLRRLKNSEKKWVTSSDWA